jgi:nicotinate-nucleotide adenylyltransferase
MLRTGLFGGSFNPIHNGHVAIARHLLLSAGLDEVWFMVSPQNPLKDRSCLLNDEKRLQLVQLALEGEPHMKACGYEFALPRPSYTWNTLCHLAIDYPDRDFMLLIGGDNFQHFGLWRNAKEIMEGYKIVVYPRADAPIDTDNLPRGVTVVDTPLLNISSTMVREMVRQGKSIDGLVPPKVAQAIAEQGLYRQ